MSKGAGFVLTMILGGIIFLLPLAFLAILLGKAFQLMMLVAEPIDAVIPMDSVGNIALVNLIAVTIILLSCFLAGFAVRSGWGGKISERVDDNLQTFIPGYGMLKAKVTATIGEAENEVGLKPVLVTFDDQSQIAFEVERAKNGLVTVFLPGAPDPWGGAAAFVTPDRVQSLDLPMSDAVRTFKKIGRGSLVGIGQTPEESQAS